MSFRTLPAKNNSESAEFASIFRTDAWISSWEKTWGAYLQQHKFFLDENFYYFSLPLWWLSVVTAIPTGCGSFNLRSIRSEYFQLQSQHQNWLSKLTQKCQQLIIPDVDLASPTFLYLQSQAKAEGYFFLQRSVATAYGIDTHKNNFADYLSQLSQSARARLFNKRKKLEQLGQLKVENIWPNIDKFIDILNGFHLERWGKPCYQNQNQEFIKLFLQTIAEQGGKVNLSVMSLNQQPISLLLDVEYAGRVYNFQAGFVEKLTNNLALGSLHLGYAIEAAFLNPAIHYYDFMAGQGKNTDYKAAFANNTQNLSTVYIIKPAWLYWLYRFNDRVKAD